MLPKTAHLLIGALTLTTRGLRSCQMALTCSGMSRLSLTRLVRHRCALEGPGINVHVANVASWYPVASYQPPTPPRNKPLLDIPHPCPSPCIPTPNPRRLKSSPVSPSPCMEGAA